MGKNKLRKFNEINAFPNVIQPDYRSDIESFEYKGKWNSNYFRNNNPIVLEIGCGKGEYTVELAKEYPDKNFIGIDIKGDRLWHGAKASIDFGFTNTAFLRTQAEKIEQYFIENEVSEIWIPFPDPQSNKPRIRKRLTSPSFIERYKNILLPKGHIHLKTDNKNLYEYTLDVIKEKGLKLLSASDDIYKNTDNKLDPAITNIQTYYEKSFIEEGAAIYYLKFTLGKKPTKG